MQKSKPTTPTSQSRSTLSAKSVPSSVSGGKGNSSLPSSSGSSISGRSQVQKKSTSSASTARNTEQVSTPSNKKEVIPTFPESPQDESTSLDLRHQKLEKVPYVHLSKVRHSRPQCLYKYFRKKKERLMYLSINSLI